MKYKSFKEFVETFNKLAAEQKSGFRKIADAPIPCLSPGHTPPSHIVLSPGTHEYTCPSCGKKYIINVPLITL